MAKITPPQNIPSELLDGYRATLGEKRPDDGVRKRYPYRVPTMQSEAGRPSPKQKAQRTRVIRAIQKFNTVPWPDRQRWYDAAPEWGSFLWYYNFFILSGLMGNAYLNSGGLGVIKSIQVMKASVPTTGGHAFTLGTEVDAAKTVVMIQGSAIKVPLVYRGSGSIGTGGGTLGLGATVDPDKCTVVLGGSGLYEWFFDPEGVGNTAIMPIITNLTTTQISIGWPRTPKEAAVIGWEVTEHVEGVVHPVLVSVTNTTVTVDWAEEPDAAADVSITVIEYI